MEVFEEIDCTECCIAGEPLFGCDDCCWDYGIDDDNPELIGGIQNGD